MRTLHGVNLGGWLVLERWITPSLFAYTAARDEYTFMQEPGARAKLRAHQRSFVTEDDFRWLRDHHIDAVRIPVGYWILRGDVPFVSSIQRLDWAFRMADTYGIDVLISLHGAPGSQNGHDHSGRIGKARWYRDASCRAATIDTLVALAKRYRDQPRFWGIELLNEPRPGLVQWKLRSFYRAAYRAVEPLVRPSTHIVFHDAFRPRLMAGALGGDRSRIVMMDIHWYHFSFWARRWMPLALYYRLVRWRGRLVSRLRHRHGVIIGEWSGALARERLDQYPSKERHGVELRHIEEQMRSYQTADAWFYWNYKTEFGGTWSLRSLIDEDGLSLEKKEK